MRDLVLLGWFMVVFVFGGCAGDEESGVYALERQLQDLASTSMLWPGFDPIEVPLAIFDGTDTYLFRHPEPPEGFTPQGTAHVFSGRHLAVVANSSAWIGDAATATLLLDGPVDKDEVTELAAVVAHEAFHVYQSTTGRNWDADESQLFMYPVDDVELLAQRRLENEALRRAFDAQDERQVAGWALRALEIRSARFAAMEPGLRTYERGIEAKEGTAYYVEFRATGRQAPEFPTAGFPIEAVRRRAYETGVSWALLLDQFRPDWRAGFADDGGRHVDQDLEEALRDVDSSSDCSFSVLDRAEAQETAQREVDELRADRVLVQQRIESTPGWRIVVEADSESPLWPQGFDPMNVRKLETGLLHTRFVKLGNATGRFEVMNDTVLTQGAGEHPLYNGIRRATITGLEAEPQIYEGQDSVAIISPTVTAGFRGAEITRSGQVITVHVHGQSEHED